MVMEKPTAPHIAALFRRLYRRWLSERGVGLHRDDTLGAQRVGLVAHFARHRLFKKTQPSSKRQTLILPKAAYNNPASKWFPHLLGGLAFVAVAFGALQTSRLDPLAWVL